MVLAVPNWNGSSFRSQPKSLISSALSQPFKIATPFPGAPYLPPQLYNFSLSPALISNCRSIIFLFLICSSALLTAVPTWESQGFGCLVVSCGAHRSSTFAERMDGRPLAILYFLSVVNFQYLFTCLISCLLHQRPVKLVLRPPRADLKEEKNKTKNKKTES